MSTPKVAKPQLRNLLVSRTKRTLIVAVGLGLAACFSYRMLVGERRKQIYAEFYRTYDAEKEFNRMRNAGVFHSCEPDA